MMTAAALGPRKAMIETRVGWLAVWEYGRGIGPAVVFWPSIFADYRMYQPVAALLPAHWRVLIIDGPGFGASGSPARGVQPDRYAEAVRDVMNKLAIGTCVFVGTSWGGQIGAHLANRAPERLKGLLMISTPLGPSIGGHWFEVIMARLAVQSSVYSNGVARSMLSKTSLKRSPGILRQFTEPFASFSRRDAAVTAATVLRSFEGLAAILPNIQVPTKFLLGEEDKLYPPETSMPFARMVPQATIDVLPGVGHLAPLEAPHAVAEAVLAFR